MNTDALRRATIYLEFHAIAHKSDAAAQLAQDVIDLSVGADRIRDAMEEQFRLREETLMDEVAQLRDAIEPYVYNDLRADVAHARTALTHSRVKARAALDADLKAMDDRKKGGGS